MGGGSMGETSHAEAMKHVLDSLSMGGGGGGSGSRGQATSSTGLGGQPPSSVQDIDPFSAFGKTPTAPAGQGSQQQQQQPGMAAQIGRGTTPAASAGMHQPMPMPG